MNNKTYFLALCSLLLLWSCGKDDAPPPPKNNLPNIGAQTFTVAENIPDAQLIGTVKATDADKDDELTFSMAQNDNGLFEITKAGGLSLATGKSLNYEAKSKHTITIAVTDGSDEAKAQMTINVTQVDPENLPPTMEPQTFTASENIPDTQLIGTVTASDPEEDELTFSILEDTDQLFEITAAGGLSLAEGNTLDFATKQEHTIEVQVSDGNSTVQATMTVKVVQTDPENQSPTMEAQSFEANEDITDTDIIGTVTANDPEGDALTFILVEDLDGLFEISEAGELSLTQGKTLDFETQTEHVLTVGVSDGTNEILELTITVTVTDVEEGASLFDDPASFITKWQVEAGQTIIIGTSETLYYDFVIDWGDDSAQEHVTGVDPTPSHNYETGDVYMVAIKGNFPAFNTLYLEQGNKDALLDVKQWGHQKWQSMEFAFSNCHNLVEFSAADKPDLSETTSMKSMFNWAKNFNGNIGHWDVSNVSNMERTFFGALAFNQDLDWNTGNVVWMQSMFSLAISFNGDISGWITENVVDMSSMFNGAVSFNRNIGNWKTGKVESMASMFARAVPDPNNSIIFNQDIGNWNTSNVLDMSYMFSGAIFFNQDLSLWKTDNVTDMAGMFRHAAAFDQDINSWNTLKVTDMSEMFMGATSFNQKLDLWNTSSVTKMRYMFKDAISFNQNFGASWVTTTVTEMDYMFAGALEFNQDIGGWDTSNVIDMGRMFELATSFDQNLGVWDISSIAFMSDMFDNSGMSHTNANATLAGWANFVQVNEGPFDIALGMENVPLCGESGDYALNVLINDYNWQIPQTFDYNPECP